MSPRGHETEAQGDRCFFPLEGPSACRNGSHPESMASEAPLLSQ